MILMGFWPIVGDMGETDSGVFLQVACLLFVTCLHSNTTALIVSSSGAYGPSIYCCLYYKILGSL